MKLLVISSSPRRGGNSDMLCDQFILGAREVGHEAEKLFLGDLDIAYCTGCGVCFDGAGNCSQSDDMPMVLDKMAAADVIVMATPVYFYSMCGQMKTFIDRTCPRYTDIKDKDFYFILTAAMQDTKKIRLALEGFRAYLTCLESTREKDVIIGAEVVAIGDVSNHPAMRQAYDAGKSI